MIVAYTFRADIYCPMCIVEKYGAVAEPGESPEETLDSIAEYRGIDRDDLYSYDSADFPKPVYDDQLTEEEETCGCCGEVIDAFDTASSNSRQHYIDTGVYLTHAQAEEWRSK